MNPAREEFEIVTVKAGVASLRSRVAGETFHPVVGPMAEARVLHVQQQRLVERAASAGERFVIWDVGLGAAANAVAVLEAFAACESAAEIELHSFDETIAPLAFACENAAQLGYLAPFRGAIDELLASGETRVGQVRWIFHRGDFRELVTTTPAPAPHAVIYDPYSAKANPEMWTLEHFARLRARLIPDAPCLLTNYTRSTAVRVTLLLAGFFLGRGRGVGEKDETTVASNARELLEAPLERDWLQRVRFSTKSAPLRAGSSAGAIGADDLRELERHPQFA